MNRLFPFYCISLAGIGLLFQGCIQEDPQMKALQDRLEKTESQLTAIAEKEQSDVASSAGRAAESQLATQKAKIAELEAKVRSLSEENEKLKKASATASTSSLGSTELLEKLNVASQPLREEIRPLYTIEKAVVRELSIPESPYSCIVHLDLVNLASGAMEEVEVRATANLQGEWQFPSTALISKAIRPRGQSMAATSSPSSEVGQTQSTSTRSSLTGERNQTTRAGEGTRETPRSSSPSGRSVPAAVPVVGQLAGETVLNW